MAECSLRGQRLHAAGRPVGCDVLEGGGVLITASSTQAVLQAHTILAVVLELVVPCRTSARAPHQGCLTLFWCWCCQVLRMTRDRSATTPPACIPSRLLHSGLSLGTVQVSTVSLQLYVKSLCCLHPHLCFVWCHVPVEVCVGALAQHGGCKGLGITPALAPQVCWYSRHVRPEGEPTHTGNKVYMGG